MVFKYKTTLQATFASCLLFLTLHLATCSSLNATDSDKVNVTESPNYYHHNKTTAGPFTTNNESLPLNTSNDNLNFRRDYRFDSIEPTVLTQEAKVNPWIRIYNKPPGTDVVTYFESNREGGSSVSSADDSSSTNTDLDSSNVNEEDLLNYAYPEETLRRNDDVTAQKQTENLIYFDQNFENTATDNPLVYENRDIWPQKEENSKSIWALENVVDVPENSANRNNTGVVFVHKSNKNNIWTRNNGLSVVPIDEWNVPEEIKINDGYPEIYNQDDTNGTEIWKIVEGENPEGLRVLNKDGNVEWIIELSDGEWKVFNNDEVKYNDWQTPNQYTFNAYTDINLGNEKLYDSFNQTTHEENKNVNRIYDVNSTSYYIDEQSQNDNSDEAGKKSWPSNYVKQSFSEKQQFINDPWYFYKNADFSWPRIKSNENSEDKDLFNVGKIVPASPNPETIKSVTKDSKYQDQIISERVTDDSTRFMVNNLKTDNKNKRKQLPQISNKDFQTTILSSKSKNNEKSWITPEISNKYTNAERNDNIVPQRSDYSNRQVPGENLQNENQSKGGSFSFPLEAEKVDSNSKPFINQQQDFYKGNDKRADEYVSKSWNDGSNLININYGSPLWVNDNENSKNENTERYDSNNNVINQTYTGNFDLGNKISAWGSLYGSKVLKGDEWNSNFVWNSGITDTGLTSKNATNPIVFPLQGTKYFNSPKDKNKSTWQTGNFYPPVGYGKQFDTIGYNKLPKSNVNATERYDSEKRQNRNSVPVSKSNVNSGRYQNTLNLSTRNNIPSNLRRYTRRRNSSSSLRRADNRTIKNTKTYGEINPNFNKGTSYQKWKFPDESGGNDQWNTKINKLPNIVLPNENWTTNKLSGNPYQTWNTSIVAIPAIDNFNAAYKGAPISKGLNFVRDKDFPFKSWGPNNVYGINANWKSGVNNRVKGFSPEIQSWISNGKITASKPFTDSTKSGILLGSKYKNNVNNFPQLNQKQKGNLKNNEQKFDVVSNIKNDLFIQNYNTGSPVGKVLLPVKTKSPAKSWKPTSPFNTWSSKIVYPKQICKETIDATTQVPFTDVSTNADVDYDNVIPPPVKILILTKIPSTSGIKIPNRRDSFSNGKTPWTLPNTDDMKSAKYLKPKGNKNRRRKQENVKNISNRNEVPNRKNSKSWNREYYKGNSNQKPYYKSLKMELPEGTKDVSSPWRPPIVMIAKEDSPVVYRLSGVKRPVSPVRWWPTNLGRPKTWRDNWRRWFNS